MDIGFPHMMILSTGAGEEKAFLFEFVANGRSLPSSSGTETQKPQHSCAEGKAFLYEIVARCCRKADAKDEEPCDIIVLWTS
jgi:hypothetical protein